MTEWDKIVEKWSDVSEDIERERDKEWQRLPKIDAKSVSAKCPKCGNTDSESLDARFRQEAGEVFFQGYEIRCLKCGESFLQSL